MTSPAVVAGALLFILFLPTQFALDLQLLGGLWILQTLPAVIFGLYTVWFRAQGLLAGCAVGFFLGGSWLAWLNGFKPLHTLHFGAASITLYSGLLALAANILVAILVSAVLRRAERGDRDLARAGWRSMREPQYPAAKVPRCLVSAAPIKIPKIAADAVTHEAFDGTRTMLPTSAWRFCKSACET
jgi:Na+/proline symporter